MATILTPARNLLSVPFSAATDFTDQADHCDRFAETLIECHDPALKMALYGRLRACLAILSPTLNDPISSGRKPDTRRPANLISAL